MQSNLIKCWKILHNLCPIKLSDLWDRSPEYRTRAHRATNSIQNKRSQFAATSLTQEHASPLLRTCRERLELLAQMVGHLTFHPDFKSSLLEVLGKHLYEYPN